MNITAILMIIMLLILILYTIIDKYTYLCINCDLKDSDIKTDLKKSDDLLIKYSSIKNKLITDNDYINFHNYLDNINTSIYIIIIKQTKNNIKTGD